MVTSIAIGSTSVALTDSFAALADPVRLRIVRVLADGGRCVCDLRHEVPIAPNLLSYHLRVLREAGLVSATRRGRWVDYRLDAGGFAELWTEARTSGIPLPGDRVTDRMDGSACEAVEVRT